MGNLMVSETGNVFDTTRTFWGAPIVPPWKDSHGTWQTRSMGWCECGRPWNQHTAAHGYCPWPKPPEPVRVYFCSGHYCPGLRWPASNTPHPTSCAIKRLNSPASLDAAEHSRREHGRSVRWK